MLFSADAGPDVEPVSGPATTLLGEGADGAATPAAGLDRRGLGSPVDLGFRHSLTDDLADDSRANQVPGACRELVAAGCLTCHSEGGSKSGRLVSSSCRWGGEHSWGVGGRVNREPFWFVLPQCSE